MPANKAHSLAIIAIDESHVRLNNSPFVYESRRLLYFLDWYHSNLEYKPRSGMSMWFHFVCWSSGGPLHNPFACITRGTVWAKLERKHFGSLLDKVMLLNQWHIGVQERHLMFEGPMQLNYSILVFTYFYAMQWRIQNFPEEGAPTPQGGANIRFC